MCANSCSSQVPRLLATRDCASLHPNDKEHAIGSSSGGSSLRQFGFLWYVPGRKRENGLGLSYILGTDVTYRVVICSSKNTCLKSQDTLWLSKACWGFCYYYLFRLLLPLLWFLWFHLRARRHMIAWHRAYNSPWVFDSLLIWSNRWFYKRSAWTWL